MRLSRLRQMTFRSRLASAFTGLFLVAGVALLTFVVVLARYGTAQQIRSIEVVASVCDRAATEDVCPRVPMPLRLLRRRVRPRCDCRPTPSASG